MDRNQEIRIEHAAGAGFAELARRYGISRQRVEQIVKHTATFREANGTDSSVVLDPPKERPKNTPEPISKQEARCRRRGMTEADFASLMLEQRCSCAICGNPIDDENSTIDHCHRTGDVRGLLCRHCNSGLGMFRDRVDVLARAIEYLKRSQRETATACVQGSEDAQSVRD